MTSAADPPQHAWLLPATLTATGPARPRRSMRDWAVDTFLFLFSLGFALFAIDDAQRVDSFFGVENAGPPWLLGLDALAGLTLVAALWLRRRWPVALTVLALPLGLFSLSSAAAGTIILFTVVVHRRPAISVPLCAIVAGTGMIMQVIRPDPTVGWWGVLFANFAIVGLVFAWGMFVRARRQLVLSLRERADRAEAEQQLRVAQARQLERTRIAREMHDVLAHRISLLSLHAGALEFRPDAAPEEVARAAGVIRSSAHEALQDLREVIGVLREDAGPSGPASADRAVRPERPQPTLAGLPALVTESREAGMRVELVQRAESAPTVPVATGRSAYRIVQEALTNARKHAPGARVTVEVGGGPGQGLTVLVRNPPPVGTAVVDGAGPSGAIPGAGTGLVGLAERALLAGGRLEHGRTDSGEFRLTAWLPWPA